MSDMIETKSFLQSATFWGLVVTVLANVLAKKGYVISDQLKDESVQLILQTIGFVLGPLIALWGRWRATKPLSVTGETKAAATVLLCVTLLAGTSSLQGCQLLSPQTTQLQRSVQAEELYAAVLRSLNTADAAHLIPVAEKPRIYESQQIAKVALQALRDNATIGDSGGYDSALKQFNAAIDQLIRLRNTAQARAPATVPS